jgi:hypothetical protein
MVQRKEASVITLSVTEDIKDKDERARAREAYDSDLKENQEIHQRILTGSRWFTLGWTLQELFASRHVVVLDRDSTPARAASASDATDASISIGIGIAPVKF